MLIIVKNSIHAYVRKSYTSGAEFQQIQLKVDKQDLELLTTIVQITDAWFSGLYRHQPLIVWLLETSVLILCWFYNHLDQSDEEIEAWQCELFLILINTTSESTF